MKAYMVVISTEDGQSAFFADEYIEARAAMVDVECGHGGYSELYEYTVDEDGEGRYVFMGY